MTRRGRAPRWARESVALLVGLAAACRPSGRDSDIAPDVAARAARAARSPAAFVVAPAEALTLAPGDTYDAASLAYDSLGTALAGRALRYTSADPRVVRVDDRGRLTATGPGRATITAAEGNARAEIRVAVRQPAERGVVDVDVFPEATFQTIEGWEGVHQMGQVECRPQSFARYKDELIPRVVNELGLNRIRIELRSGVETHSLADPGGNEAQSTDVVFRTPWFRPENDNDDPYVADSTGFQFERFDYDMTHSVLPIRRLLAERGESLYLALTYVDFFESTPFEQMSDPEEYAELLAVTFTHMRQTFGFVPDGVEALLEPDNTPWTPEQLGRAIVAAGDRLEALGYTPEFIAPSTGNQAEAVWYYDRMRSVPRLLEYVKELSYHRYSGTSEAALRAIALRAKRDGLRTAMLEHIPSGPAALYKDLTLGGVSAWERFAIAFCARRANPEAEGVYYQINLRDPNRPEIVFPTEARLLSQYFAFIRRGAVRLGAASGAEAVQPVAFRNVDGKAVLVVRAEHGSKLRVTGLPAGSYASSWRTATRNGTGAVAAVTPGGELRADIPDAGVLTIYAR